MSTCAMLFVLFERPPSAARLAALDAAIANRLGQPLSDDCYGRLAPLDAAAETAERYADVRENGTLVFPADWRTAPSLAGVPRWHGRLLKIPYLARYWAPDLPQGPAMWYALTMLTLLREADVQRVWYGTESYRDGCELAPMAYEDVHAMIDAYVAHGIA